MILLSIENFTYKGIIIEINIKVREYNRSRSDKVSRDDFFEATEFICTYSAELVLKRNPSIDPP